MPNSPELLIAICVYNEMDNLPWLYEKLRGLPLESAIVVVDDNSPDGTGDWCDKTANDDPHFFVIHREGKLGLGSASLAAFRFGVESGYRYILTMDGDRSHSPTEVPDVYAKLLEDPQNQISIGSRYVPGGRIENWPLMRHVMSRCINGFSRLMIGLPIADYSSAFRCYRVELLRKIDLSQISATGYAYLEELLWHAGKTGARIVEQPIVFADRVKGSSKINLKEAVRAVWLVFRIGVGRLLRKESLELSGHQLAAEPIPRREENCDVRQRPPITRCYSLCSQPHGR